MVKSLLNRIQIFRIHFLVLSNCLLFSLFSNVTAQSQESLSVSLFNNTIEQFSIRGLDASFPHSILCFISVVDRDSEVVRRLANTSRWLGPNDFTDNNRLISETWNPILEFHKYNPSVPLNPNLYDQTPAPKFIEICESCESVIPVSTMLLMDLSSSIRGEFLERGKAGIKHFIEDMRPPDRTGIIQFAGVNDSLPTLPLTSNKDSLIAFADTAQIDDWTPLYRALMKAIQEIKDETSIRRSIIIYTDGKNALPESEVEIFTPDSIVTKAQKYKIPIFTIALNRYTNEKVLKQIANQTGGFFFKSIDGAELNDIYRKISDILQNFYVMAYASPDPCSQDSVRSINVTVNDSNRTGHDESSYSYSGPSKNYDLALFKGSNMDTVCTGDEFQYALTIRNQGPATAFNFELSDAIPEFITPSNFNPPPDRIQGKTVFWKFDSLAFTQETTVTFNAKINGKIPVSISTFVNTGQVYAACDTNAINDISTDTIIFAPSKCYTDITVTKYAKTGSFTVQETDTLWFADEEESFSYFITVSNEADKEAQNVALTDTLPEFVLADSLASKGVIQWELGNLPPFSDTTLTYSGTVSPDIPEGTNLLINRVFVQTDNEDPGKLLNNVAIDTVYNIRLADISVTSSARTDSFVVNGSDTLWFADAGESYTYYITVSNEDNLEATNVVLKNVLPDTVQVNDFFAGDTVQWNLGNILPFSDTTVTFSATVSPNMPEGTNLFIHKAFVQAENEDPDKLANNTAIDTVYNYVEPVVIDVSVFSTAKTDSFIVEEADTLWFADAGESFSYFITVSNETKFEAENIVVKDILPDSVCTDTFFAGDTLQWNLGNLAPFSDTTLIFSAAVSPNMPEGTNLLINTVFIQADDEEPDKLSNNSATDTVFNYVEPVIIDVSVFSTAKTDSFVVASADTLWFVDAGESFSYFITVSNETKFEAENIVVKDILPDSVRAENFFAGDTLQWKLGSLAPYSDTTMTFSAAISPNMPEGTNLLINTVFIQADDEEPDKFSNNSATDTVYNYVEPVIIDVAVFSTAKTDSFVVEGADTLWFADAGKSFSYFITVSNETKFEAENVVVKDILPDSVRTDAFFAGDTLQWELGSLAPFSDTTLTFGAVVAPNMPEGTSLLNNTVYVEAKNEDSGMLANNMSIYNIYSYVEPVIIDISVYSTVKTDSFQVQGADTLWFVKSGETYSYFITITNESKFKAENVIIKNILPDSVRVENYSAGDTLQWHIGDLLPFARASVNFEATVSSKITTNVLELTNKVLVQADKENPELLFNNISINKVFTVPPNEGCALFNLDLNVFLPEKDDLLGINFELNSSRPARLDIYDISGYHIRELTETTFNSGSNRFEWDATTDNGQKVGSGTYIITLRSGNLICWKKVIIVR